MDILDILDPAFAGDTRFASFKLPIPGSAGRLTGFRLFLF
jgi:hypothetical protein